MNAVVGLEVRFRAAPPTSEVFHSSASRRSAAEKERKVETNEKTDSKPGVTAGGNPHDRADSGAYPYDVSIHGFSPPWSDWLILVSTGCLESMGRALLARRFYSTKNSGDLVSNPVFSSPATLPQVTVDTCSKDCTAT